jgi:hypothetical protein
MDRRFLLLIALLLGLCLVPAARAEEPEAPVQRHAVEVVTAGHVIQQVLGPMPAIAGTPFLGLAVLSGAALLSDTDAVRTSDSALVRGFHDNALIAEARRYSTPGLFFALLALSFLTYLTNSGKIRGAVGKLLRAGEDSSVLVTYVLLAVVTLAGVGTAPPPKVAAMGFVGLPGGVLVSLGLAMGLSVFMTVRFAFDVLIWLSPFPMVDFTFETLKKLLSLGFLALYFLSPVAAAVIALVLLIPALFIYGWAVRILAFVFRIVLRPLLAKIFPALRPELAGAELALPAAALAVNGLRRREPGGLQRTGDGIFFVTAPLLRRRRRIALSGRRLVLARALLWLELRAVHPDGRTDRFALPRTDAQDFERLRALLGAEDGGLLGVVRAFGRLLDPAASTTAV